MWTPKLKDTYSLVRYLGNFEDCRDEKEKRLVTPEPTKRIEPVETVPDAVPEATTPDAVDANLIRALAGGDEASLAMLYDRYSSILLGLLFRILQSRAEAEDVLQEVFLQVWQRAADFDESRGRAFTWLVTLARSRALDRLRRLESRERVKREVAAASEGRTEEAFDCVVRLEERELLRRALDCLPEPQRRTLMLAYFEDLTQTEIATRTGEPLGTIKTRIRSGLSKLHELLQKPAASSEE